MKKPKSRLSQWFQRWFPLRPKEKKTEHFKFTPKEMTASESVYCWNNDFSILSVNATRYVWCKIKGVQCLEKIDANGDSELAGEDDRFRITKTRGNPIFVTEVLNVNPLKYLPRKISTMDENGKETPLREFFYDERYNVIKQIEYQPEPLVIHKQEGFEIVKSLNTKKTLWEKNTILADASSSWSMAKRSGAKFANSYTAKKTKTFS